MKQDDDAIKVGHVPSLRGALAKAAGYDLPLQVLKSQAGYYIGTWNDDGPITRESAEYWRTENKAAEALHVGTWTQRRNL